VARGERTAIFTFDERLETILERTAGLGIGIAEDVESGRIVIQPIDPAELSPGEFTHAIRVAVERDEAAVVVIDSLNGYLNAMPEERFLIAQLHELLTYLGHKGVVTFLLVAQHGLVGAMQSPIDTTYLADAVVLFRSHLGGRGPARYEPLERVELGDLVERHAKANIELAVDDDLPALWQRVIASTLDFSGIRLRNASMAQ